MEEGEGEWDSGGGPYAVVHRLQNNINLTQGRVVNVNTV